MATAGQRVVVITGASSGIGRETAGQFAAQGRRWCWRRAASRPCRPRPTRSPGPARRRWSCRPTWRCGRRCSTSRRQPGSASAGSTCGSTTPRCPATGSCTRCPSRPSTGSWTSICAARCTGSRRSCRSCAHRDGTIIGVSSGLGVRAVPLMVPYCIAKSGVNALYEGLRLEERRARSGVRVTVILPASIDTPFYDTAASWMGVRPAPIPPVYQARAVAEAVVFAADHPRRDLHIGAAAELAMLQRLSPALTDRLLTVGGQVFKRQQRNLPDQGQSNLAEPAPGSGAVNGGVVRFALPRSRWTRLVGFHPARARVAAIATVGAVGWRLAHLRALVR